MKVLIANRGEIAIRVIRALREMGLKSVAIYSEEDKNALFVSMADEAWCIGPASPSESYLHFKRVISAAIASGAKAVHPGYGFLAENGLFAEACEEAGLLFIGPKGKVLKELADKAKTKDKVMAHGVPGIPGFKGTLEGPEAAKKAAQTVGYPLLLKASFGGGGRGIYLVKDPAELERAYGQAMTESKGATGRDELYMEKFLEDTRHVEIQVARDLHGNVQAFVERDCTIQRRNQKLLEETPSPFVDEKTRQIMMKAAASAVEACDLTGLSTVECLLLPDKKTFYFMEINKRIQVEHPVTEELLGLDLVQLQISMALGEKMPSGLDRFNQFGSRHSIELRLNAEDPAQSFMPGEGLITCYTPAAGPGIRVDSGLTHGSRVGTSYDSLLAKLIATSPYGRKGAIAKLQGALREFVIEGVPTTIPLHTKILSEQQFASGKDWFNTKFLEGWLPKQNFN